MSTLQRETNPKSGYAPSLLPQHESKNGAYLPTGENNPLPAAGYIQTAAGLYIPQKGTDDGSANVNVKNLPIKQNVSLADKLPAGDNLIGKMLLSDSVGLEIASSTQAYDGLPSDKRALVTFGNQYFFNGGSWDRARNNYESTLLARAARTASISTPLQTNYNARGVILYLNVTSAPASVDEYLTIELKMNISSINSWGYATYKIKNETGVYALMVYPGISVVEANRVKQYSAIVPRSWYGAVTHPNTTAQWEYSLSHALIL